MKQGAIELPAVMIFIIIAGSLIMLFFVVLVQNQGESANRNIQATSLQRLDALLKGAGTARETENNLTISDEPLHYSCEEFGGGEQTIARLAYESGVDTQIFNQVVFSPEELSGGQLRTYTKGAKTGYRVTTVLYASTSSFIVQNATTLYDYPSNFLHRNLSEGVAPDPRWRTVITADQINEPRFNSHRDLIIIDEKPGGYGSVQYLRRDAQGNEEPVETIYYPTHELLYGAILSEDAATYNCMLNRYLRQLEWVNAIEQERLLKLKEASFESACYVYYQEFPYNDIAGVAAAPAFGSEQARTLAEASSQIEFMNDNLIRGSGGESCAWLY